MWEWRPEVDAEHLNVFLIILHFTDARSLAEPGGFPVPASLANQLAPRTPCVCHQVLGFQEATTLASAFTWVLGI